MFMSHMLTDWMNLNKVDSDFFSAVATVVLLHELMSKIMKDPTWKEETDGLLNETWDHLSIEDVDMSDNTDDPTLYIQVFNSKNQQDVLLKIRVDMIVMER